MQHGRNCRQVTTGKLKLLTGNIKEHSDLYNTGAGYAVQRSGIRKGQGPGTKNGAIRTTYCCSIHPTYFMCKKGKYTCWQEHLADCSPIAL